MNITIQIFKKYCLLAILLTSVVASCSYNRKDCCSVTKEFINTWQADSTGCLNLRRALLEKSNITPSYFINSNFGCVQSKLRKPDLIKTGNDYKHCYYFISCKYLSFKSKTMNPEGATMIVFKVNKDDTITDTFYMIP